MAPQVFRYPSTVGLSAQDKWIRFDAKAGRHIMRSMISENTTADNTINSVVLYLTESVLKSSISVDWQQGDMGVFAGALIADAAQTGRNVIDAYKKSEYQGIATQLADGVGSLFATGIGSAGGLAAQEIQKIMNDLGAADGSFEVASGMRVNPRTDIYFGTQHYRTNEMSFALIPRNLDEANMIDNIVHFFQYYMLPKYSTAENNIPGARNAEGSMMGFPYEFEINVYASKTPDTITNKTSDTYGPQIMEHVAKIGRSVLKNVSIDHAGGDKVSFIKDNNEEFYPSVTTLSLSWQECRLLGRGDLEIERKGTWTFNDSTNDPRF